MIKVMIQVGYLTSREEQIDRIFWTNYTGRTGHAYRSDPDPIASDLSFGTQIRPAHRADAVCEGISDMQQASGIFAGIFCHSRNHTERKCTHGGYLHPRRPGVGRKIIKACDNLSVGAEANLRRADGQRILKQPYCNDFGGNKRQGRGVWRIKKPAVCHGDEAYHCTS